jgi:hypothetical protein
MELEKDYSKYSSISSQNFSNVSLRDSLNINNENDLKIIREKLEDTSKWITSSIKGSNFNEQSHLALKK